MTTSVCRSRRLYGYVRTYYIQQTTQPILIVARCRLDFVSDAVFLCLDSISVRAITVYNVQLVCQIYLSNVQVIYLVCVCVFVRWLITSRQFCLFGLFRNSFVFHFRSRPASSRSNKFSVCFLGACANFLREMKSVFCCCLKKPKKNKNNNDEGEDVS